MTERVNTKSRRFIVARLHDDFNDYAWRSGHCVATSATSFESLGHASCRVLADYFGGAQG